MRDIKALISAELLIVLVQIHQLEERRLKSGADYTVRSLIKTHTSIQHLIVKPLLHYSRNGMRPEFKCLFFLYKATTLMFFCPGSGTHAILILPVA